MLHEYEYSREYLMIALESGPRTLSRLLHDLTYAEADFRPFDDRFTLREMVCHVASWEAVYYSRIALAKNEEEPVAPLFVEADIISTYAAKDVASELARFASLRQDTVALLQSLDPSEWSRVAIMQNVGRMSIEARALLVVLHDVNHFDQATEWRELYRQSS